MLQIVWQAGKLANVTYGSAVSVVAAVPCMSRGSAPATLFFAFGFLRFRNIATPYFYSGSSGRFCSEDAQPEFVSASALHLGTELVKPVTHS